MGMGDPSIDSLVEVATPRRMHFFLPLDMLLELGLAGHGEEGRVVPVVGQSVDACVGLLELQHGLLVRDLLVEHRGRPQVQHNAPPLCLLLVWQLEAPVVRAWLINFGIFDLL